MPIKPLTSNRVDEVVELLGFAERPVPDLDGLRALYSAWCRCVPFDNLRKLVALHYEMPELPGIDPADFFAAWQFTGAGATCWGGNNAIHALLTGLGFEAELWGASMFDVDMNHGTTIVPIDGTRWVVDTAIHCDVPLPLVDGEQTSVDHAGFVVTARPDPGGWLIDIPTPDPGFLLPCRLHREIDYAITEEANEKSRGSSPFNDDVMAGINDDTGVWMLRNGTLARFDASGTTTSGLTAAEVDEWLVEIVGHSPQLVGEVRAVLAAKAETAES